MTETQVRTAIQTVLAEIQTDWTAYDLAIDTENRGVVDQTSPNPYLCVEIDFMGGEQADMADRPLVKEVGQIVIEVVTKGGSGTVAGAALRDFITPYFDMKTFGELRTHACEKYRGRPKDGLYRLPLLINFWLHRVSA